MDTALKIHPYCRAHAQGVIDLILSIQQDEFDIPITAEDQPDLKNVAGFYQTGSGNFWVAKDNDTVVGTIALLDIGNHEAALRKMFVKASHRGGQYGIAKALLEMAIQWAKDTQIREIYLGTTPKFLAAHRFYEKNRFKEIPKASLPQNFPVMTVDTKFYHFKV